MIGTILFTICLHHASLQGGWHGNQGQEVNQCQLEKWSPRRHRAETLLRPLTTRWEGYLGSGRVAGQVEPGCVEGSDIFAEMLMRRQLICINSAVSEKSSGIQNTPDGHLLLWKCLFCCRITMLQSNSSKIENGFLIKLVGFVAGAVEAKIVRCVMLTK